MPLNIDTDRLHSLAEVLGCATGTLPFPYLGLPLGTTRPTIADLTPLAAQVERRMNACARLLDYGGRLTLVQSVLSSLPTHYLCSLKLPKGFIKIFDRARRHCLWAKEEGAGTPHSLAAWELVCRPKKHGGLGVINLEIQNKALLMKHLHKFFSRADIPWVQLVWSNYAPGPPHAQSPRGSFWWKDIFSLVELYRSITKSEIHNGDSTLFWKDFWHNDHLLCDVYPQLYSFVLNEDTSVSQMRNLSQLGDAFAIPISVQAFEQYEHISAVLQNMDLSDTRQDVRSYTWGGSDYTAAKLYKFLFAQVDCDPIIKVVWRSRCMHKLKVFLWLIL